MSRKRLLISIAAALAARDRRHRLQRRRRRRRSRRRSPSADDDDAAERLRQDGEDHRERAADRPRLARRDLEGRQGGGRRSTTTSTSSCSQAADADSQAQQIEQAIAKKPDALVVLPQDGAALTPVAQKAERAGIPVVNIDRLFTRARRGDGDDPRRQLPDRRSGGELHRRPAEVQGQRRRDPGPGRHLGHDRPDARASPTRSRRSARTAASRSSPRSRATSTPTRA